MSDTPPPELAGFDPREVDSQYRPFPAFRDWRGSSVDTRRLQQYADFLKGNPPPEMLAKAIRSVTRAAALDTGAIEGLYEVDRGITFTVASQAISWETTLAAQGPDVPRLFQAQLSAYELVVDFATQAVPIAEAWIRHLHTAVCAAQETYWVHTRVGPQKQTLLRGQYKVHPNHVRTPEGTIHAYAPADLTADEMHRLVGELTSEAFAAAHPVIQAAYAHYAFVVIHPFADGNGRVARALASVFTCRSFRMPLVILVEHRDEYLTALRAADRGDHQTFVNFILERSLDTLSWASEALELARYEEPSETRDQIERLYVTKSGLSHDDVDQAAFELIRALTAELQTEVGAIKSAHLEGAVSQGRADPKTILENYRKVVNSGGNTSLHIDLRTSGVAAASVGVSLIVQVPSDYSHGDDLVVQGQQKGGLEFRARVTEFNPVKGSLLIRARMFTKRVVAVLMNDLKAEAEKKLRSGGY